MKVIGVIPARYGSTRFPGKPLALVKNKPLLLRVWERVCLAKTLSDVIIATDDNRIADAAKKFGAIVEMTSKDCASGTERVAEVALRHNEAKVFINIQGDEPLISPATIDAIAGVFTDSKEEECVTAYFPTTKNDTPSVLTPDTAKLILDKNGYALYFSRAPIPSPARHSKVKDIIYLKHIGIYGYTRDFLVNKLKNLQPAPMEEIEQLEQLRFLWNGIKIKCVRAESDSIGVDSPEDIRKIEKFLTD